MITGTMCELPSGSGYRELAESIMQPSTGQALQLTDQCSTAQAVPAWVNCGVDLCLRYGGLRVRIAIVHPLIHTQVMAFLTKLTARR